MKFLTILSFSFLVAACGPTPLTILEDMGEAFSSARASTPTLVTKMKLECNGRAPTYHWIMLSSGSYFFQASDQVRINVGNVEYPYTKGLVVAFSHTNRLVTVFCPPYPYNATISVNIYRYR